MGAEPSSDVRLDPALELGERLEALHRRHRRDDRDDAAVRIAREAHELGVCAVAVALTIATGATGTPNRATGTLQLDVTFRQYWCLDRAYCPPGTPTAYGCLRSLGEEEIAGLGRTTSTYSKILPFEDDCFMIQNTTAVFEVAGKGTLELSRAGKICASGPPPRVDGPFAFTISGGSGNYAHASGSLSYKASIPAGDGACQCGTAVDTWTGTLIVPGLDFDTTAPTITGAAAKTVRAPKGAKRMRVRYAVTATDAVDGAVAVACTPRSGSFFTRGRTKVSCSATDSSGNTAKAAFTVTVK